MRKFEYSEKNSQVSNHHKMFEYTYGVIYSDFDNELANIGENGWEIFSIEERSDGTYKYYAKREKIEEIDHNRYHIVNEFSEDTYFDSNEIYVNIGNCSGDIWEKNLWKKTYIDYIDKEGIHTKDYGIFRDFIPVGLFKPNNLDFSLERMYHFRNF
ncbi:MAG: hypothetical protein J1F35_08135 [Erysipelotrichales bacterium]|nr:hypothetical protein [Erysipelotrichales bacterium]